MFFCSSSWRGCGRGWKWRAKNRGNLLDLKTELIPVLLVALLTWGGVMFYLFRLESLAKSLEARAADRELADDLTPAETARGQHLVGE